MSGAVSPTALLNELRRRVQNERYKFYKPYAKQIQFCLSLAKIVAFFAGNQCGKSDIASYAVFCHLTGLYPEWWDGPKFDRPINAWCVGITNESTRDNPQRKLFGKRTDKLEGGWVPPELIVDWSTRRNIADALDTVWVKHVSGGVSTVAFKSNEMGVAKLMGPTLDLVWGDEELDKEVFDELMWRMNAVPDGKMLLTFTPLKGMTPLVMFLHDEDDPKIVERIHMTAYEAEHITEEQIENMKKLYAGEPHLLKARLEGIPTIGQGLIYPFELDKMFIRPFEIERWWPRLGGIDFGWNAATAIGACAVDPDSGIYYWYKMHYASEVKPREHCNAIRGWGDIDYACDPAGLQTKLDGEKVMHEYLNELQPGWEGIADEHRRLFAADNSPGIGIATVYELLSEGRMYFFNTPEFEPLKREFMTYRWDPKNPNKPIKANDHALDMIRYVCMSKGRFRRMGAREVENGISFKQWRQARPGY